MRIQIPREICSGLSGHCDPPPEVVSQHTQWADLKERVLGVIVDLDSQGPHQLWVHHVLQILRCSVGSVFVDQQGFASQDNRAHARYYLLVL